MTIKEFCNTRFSKDTMVEVNSMILSNETDTPVVRKVFSINFDQALIGVKIDDEDEYVSWYRCENCRIIKNKEE